MKPAVVYNSMLHHSTPFQSSHLLLPLAPRSPFKLVEPGCPATGEASLSGAKAEKERVCGGRGRMFSVGVTLRGSGREEEREGGVLCSTSLPLPLSWVLPGHDHDVQLAAMVSSSLEHPVLQRCGGGGRRGRARGSERWTGELILPLLPW